MPYKKMQAGAFRFLPELSKPLITREGQIHKANFKPANKSLARWGSGAGGLLRSQPLIIHPNSKRPGREPNRTERCDRWQNRTGKRRVPGRPPPKFPLYPRSPLVSALAGWHSRLRILALVLAAIAPGLCPAACSIPPGAGDPAAAAPGAGPPATERGLRRRWVRDALHFCGGPRLLAVSLRGQIPSFD